MRPHLCHPTSPLWDPTHRYILWDTSTGERVLDVSELRDVQWASWSCPLGLPVVGVYPKMSDGSDIHSAHRSPDGRLLVTADEFRKVN